MEPAAPSLAAKLAFLADPRSYPEGTARVEVVRTHLSCVFLTDRHAYKLKKPLRRGEVDLTTLEARRRACQAELRLNRRLAGEVYQAVVPLRLRPDGGLALGEGPGEPVEWLVRMRRLPRERMLDALVRRGEAEAAGLERLARRLARFYREAPREPLPGPAYRERLARELAQEAEALAAPGYALPGRLLRETVRRLEAFLAGAGAGLLEARMAAGRLLEGHGDLRPEHCLPEEPPVVIDCLDFSRALRLLDPADELGYLAMECAFLGDPATGERLLEAFWRASRDRPPRALVRFHQARRALLRARLSAWHVPDAGAPEAPRWLGRALRYLELAASLARELPA